MLIFEICSLEICEMFIYKHSEIMEYVKIRLLFKKFTDLMCQ